MSGSGAGMWVMGGGGGGGRSRVGGGCNYLFTLCSRRRGRPRGTSQRGSGVGVWSGFLGGGGCPLLSPRPAASQRPGPLTAMLNK